MSHRTVYSDANDMWCSQNTTKSGLRRAKSGVVSEKKIEKSKNLVCSQCPFYTFDGDALRTHIADVHDGEKAHRCQVCQKRFTYEDSLKRHMNQHQHFVSEFRCEVGPAGSHCTERSAVTGTRQSSSAVWGRRCRLFLTRTRRVLPTRSSVTLQSTLKLSVRSYQLL